MACHYVSIAPVDYWSSFNSVCGIWFACASMATPDCSSIWFLVRLTTSSAMSVSRMVLSEDAMFSLATFKEVMLLSRTFFWVAPSAAL